MFEVMERPLNRQVTSSHSTATEFAQFGFAAPDEQTTVIGKSKTSNKFTILGRLANGIFLQREQLLLFEGLVWPRIRIIHYWSTAVGVVRRRVRADIPYSPAKTREPESAKFRA